MTDLEFYQVIEHIKSCNDYLEGKIHNGVIQQIAKDGAEKAVLEYREALHLDLAEAGLRLEK
jgi:hypothetical protein